jgi:hypothetical protein
MPIDKSAGGLRLRAPSPTAGLLLGALVGYAVFVTRTFLSVNDTMVFDLYVPAGKLIGNDLRITLSHAAMLFNSPPYFAAEPMPYPPLALLILKPLTWIPFPLAYRLVVALTIAGFLWLVLTLSGRLTGRRPLEGSAMFLTGVGLLSYPFQFEIERGQWNVVAVAAAIAGALIARRSRGGWRRAAGFALFVMGAHLKVYPAILAVAFWRRSETVMSNLIRMAVLTVLAIAALLVTGVANVRDFLLIVLPYTAAPYVWVGNHSVQAFASQAHISAIPSALLIAVMLAAAAWRLLRRDVDGVHPVVMSALMLAMLLIPSTSHDYTLSVLPCAMSLMVGWAEASSGDWLRAGTRWLIAGLATVGSAAYHLALVPFTAKTQLGPWSMNPHPELMVLVAIVLLSLLLMPATRPQP